MSSPVDQIDLCLSRQVSNYWETKPCLQIAKGPVEMGSEERSNRWDGKRSARAKLLVIFRRLLRKYGYPPDKEEKATQTVLEQAELMCKEWAC